MLHVEGACLSCRETREKAHIKPGPTSLLEDAVMVGKGAEGTYSRGWDPASPAAFLQHGHTAGSIQPQFDRHSWTGQGSHRDRGPACKPPGSC